MNKERGFLDYCRKEPGYRPVRERLKDYAEVERRLTDDEIREQSARCMDCGTPFCHGCGCPLGNVVPEFNDHVFHHRWEDALNILLSTDPFPEFTGRICPALCEGSCVLGLNDDPVSIRQVELAIIEKAFQAGYIRPQPPAERRHETVAVVGSGPAGLTCANELNRAGIKVTVFETAQRPGGILRYGIPEFKLEKAVVDRRIRLMEEEGVVFETGVEIGNDISYRYLEGRFDAMVLTGGAREPRDLPVPGRGLDGIHFAMEYLVQQNRRLGGEAVAPADVLSAEGKHVVVIGGGDTGSDCIGTAWRQGAASVSQFEIMPRPPDERSGATPWPLWPVKLRTSSSHLEGGARRWCVMTKEFLGEEGRVKALRAVEVEWRTPEGGGRPTPVEKADSVFDVKADLVLLAMGFVGPGRNRLVEELQLAKDARGFLEKNPNHMTSRDGIFVAGDMTQGASLVVRAMADGIQTARGILNYLA